MNKLKTTLITFFIFMFTVNLCLFLFASTVSAQVKSNIDVFDVKDMDILDVLKLISQKSGINIIAGQNVRGRVTVFLKNIDPIKALNVIAEAYNWAFIQENDVIKVITAQEYESRYGKTFGLTFETRLQNLSHINPTEMSDILNQIKSNEGKITPLEQSQAIILIESPQKIEEMLHVIELVDKPKETAVFELSYVDIEGVSHQIAEMLTPGIGRLESDGRSQKLIITDTPEVIQKVRRLVAEFDERHREVLIEAKIVQIALNDEHKLGVNWQAMVSKYKSLNFSNNFDILSSTEKSGRVSIGAFENDNYEVLIEGLDTIGETEILSSPRIVAVNKQEAKILVGSTEPYVTSTTTTPSSGPSTTAETVNFIEVGVKLFVTPTIHRDNFITLNIKPEVSSVVDNITTGSNNTIPVVETSEAETTVLIKDGVTLVIGGLIKEEKIETKKQVPFLGRVPVLGAAFRNKAKSSAKTEIAIFLTPHIIEGN